MVLFFIFIFMSNLAYMAFKCGNELKNMSQEDRDKEFCDVVAKMAEQKSETIMWQS